MGLGADFVASVLKSESIKEFLGCQPQELVFLPTEVETYQALHAHIVKYGKVPSESALNAAVGGDADIAEFPGDDPPKYHYDLLVERWVSRSLQMSIVEAQATLKGGLTHSPSEAYQQLMASLLDVGQTFHRNIISDVRERANTYMAEYKRKFFIHSGEEPAGLLFGWPTLDQQSIGLGGGNVISYVGRPALGKTFMMLATALYAWLVKFKPVAFATMEMEPELIMDRVMSMKSHLPIESVMNATLNSHSLKKLSDHVIQVGALDTPFYLIDGNMAATVPDLYGLCAQLGLGALFIDGAYMLKHEDERLNRYAKVGENCELIKKALATGLSIPVVCSYQFNREVVKKSKKKIDPMQAGLEDIGYSDAIGQYSSIVLGLFETENVETLTARMITILKNRYFPALQFKVRWDLDVMDFTEISQHNEADLEYI